jgi:hypothetical protein
LGFAISFSTSKDMLFIYKRFSLFAIIQYFQTKKQKKAPRLNSQGAHKDFEQDDTDSRIDRIKTNSV